LRHVIFLLLVSSPFFIYAQQSDSLKRPAAKKHRRSACNIDWHFLYFND
jgi:hypothetical protein